MQKKETGKNEEKKFKISKNTKNQAKIHKKSFIFEIERRILKRKQ
jgi:hypothetical protein